MWQALWCRCRHPGECYGCRCRERRLAAEKASDLIARAYARGGCCWTLEVPLDRWDTVGHAINRRRGEYLAVVTPDGGSLIVVTTVEVRGATRLADAVAAVKVAMEAIHQAPARDPAGLAKRWRPIRWSVGWQDPAREPSGWRHEGLVGCTPAVLTRVVLPSLDLKPVVDATFDDSTVLRQTVWPTPSLWTDDQIESIKEAIASRQRSEIGGESPNSDTRPDRGASRDDMQADLARYDEDFVPGSGLPA
jgi:hypothetical protein